MERVWLAEDDEMAFSPDNQEWIHTQIQNALDRALKGINPPSGFKKALYFLREWSVLAINFTVILTLLIFALTQWNAANARLTAEAVFRTHTEDRLDGIEKSLLTIRAKAVVSNPADSENLAEVRNILAVAKRKSISLPLPIVQEGGEKFIQAAKDTPSVWGAALELVSYRTVLNSNNGPSGSFGTLPRGKTWEYAPPDKEMMVPGKQKPNLSFADASVPSEQAARLERIGTNLNAEIPVGPLFLIMQDGAYRIDNQEIRSVFFKDVEVHYSGGPLILKNVTFINCIFVMDNGTNARSLGMTLLASAKITFRTES